MKTLEEPDNRLSTGRFELEPSSDVRAARADQRTLKGSRLAGPSMETTNVGGLNPHAIPPEAAVPAAHGAASLVGEQDICPEGRVAPPSGS